MAGMLAVTAAHVPLQKGRVLKRFAMIAAGHIRGHSFALAVSAKAAAVCTVVTTGGGGRDQLINPSYFACAATASAICSTSSSGRSWPMPWISSNSAPLIAAAVSRPPSTGTNGSAAP